MELDSDKCPVLSMTLKRYSSFHDNDILGAKHMLATSHDYLLVALSSDLNWLRHAKIIIIRLPIPLVSLKPIANKVLVRPLLEYDGESWKNHTMKCAKKIWQIHGNSCRFIFQECRRNTNTTGLINRLNLVYLNTSWLIQWTTMFYKIHYNLVDICPPSYIQHANHIPSRTDHPLRHCI